jgi:hypothetical protein
MLHVLALLVGEGKSTSVVLMYKFSNFPCSNLCWYDLNHRPQMSMIYNLFANYYQISPERCHFQLNWWGNFHT